MASALPQLHRLEVLLLGGNGIGPQGARFLAKDIAAISATLQELDLSENGLGPEGIGILVAPLQGLPKLRSLRLRSGWASSEGIESLLGLLRGLAPQLEKLDLSQNRLGADSLRALLRDLPEMPELQSLSLAENPFATAGLVAMPDASSFESLGAAMPKLSELDLSGTGLGSDEFTLRAIARGMPQSLVSLQLSASKLQDRQLQGLLQELPVLPKLQSLTLVQAQMNDVALNVLLELALGDKLPRLHTLDVRGNMVSAGAIDHFHKRMMCSSSIFRVLRSNKAPRRPSGRK